MSDMLTKRQKIVLAALAADRGAAFAPVQVQKLFFLMDAKLADILGGKQFAFEPYDYGPFDRAVYVELECLAKRGLASIAEIQSGERRRYSLTNAGQSEGELQLKKLPEEITTYLATLSSWVRSLSFAQLVGSVYRAYPEMRAHSIFQD